MRCMQYFVIKQAISLKCKLSACVLDCSSVSAPVQGSPSIFPNADLELPFSSLLYTDAKLPIWSLPTASSCCPYFLSGQPICSPSNSPTIFKLIPTNANDYHSFIQHHFGTIKNPHTDLLACFHVKIPQVLLLHALQDPM